MRQSVRKINARLAAELACRFLLAALFLLVPMLGAYAAKDYDKEEAASLKVEVKATAQEEGKEGEPVIGVELSVVPVAELNRLDSGEFTFVPDEKFEGTAISAEMFSESMTASKSNQIAAVLEKYVQENKEKFKDSSKKVITGNNGTADFGTLPYHGIYLVYQSGADNAASSYTTVSAFLVQVPYYSEEEGWVYDVKTMPKTMDKNEKPVNPPKPPEKKPTVKKGGGSSGKVKTGDEADYRLWAILIFSSAVLLLLIGSLRKKEDSKDRTKESVSKGFDS